MFKKQLLAVKCLPETLPSQAEENKLATPYGHIAMNMLAESECLYCDLVADLATRFGGVCVNFYFVAVYYSYNFNIVAWNSFLLFLVRLLYKLP